VQPNKAVVGRNAFAHEAGIHQDGVLKERRTYEIMTPESVGIPTNRLVLGKHSGRHALGKKLAELGYKLTRPELDKVYSRFIEIADQKKEIFDEDLIAIAHEGMKEIPETYRLKVLQATAGSQKPSTATVTLQKAGADMVACAVGDGPVAATYNAIDLITNFRGRLVDYAIRSVSRGRDAMGEVFVHVDFGGRTFTGKAASTDVVDASAMAYLHAVNKALHLSHTLEAAVGREVAAPVPAVSEGPVATRLDAPGRTETPARRETAAGSQRRAVPAEDGLSGGVKGAGSDNIRLIRLV